MIGDHDPEAKKDEKDDVMVEDGDHVTDHALDNNLVPPPKEHQDFEKFDDNENSNRGPTLFEKEKTNDISEDFDNSEYSEDSRNS